MPDENSKMDDLLKAYTTKRREEVGAPLEMHPVTRQMLQSEVKRTFAKAEKTSAAKRALHFLIWPRLAVGGGFLAVFLGLLFWFQPRDTVVSGPAREMAAVATKSAQREKLAFLDEKRSRQEAVVAPGATADVPVPLDESFTIAQSKAATNETDKNVSTDTLAASSVRDAEKPASGLAATDESVVSVTNSIATIPEGQIIASAEIPPPSPEPVAEADDFKRDLRGRLKEQESARVAQVEAGKLKAESAPLPAAPPASVALESKVVAQKKLARAQRTDASQARLYFAQETSRYRQNLLSPPQPEVLTAFHFEKVGDRVRIVDDDGSVYEGEIQLADADDALRKKAPAETKENNLEDAAKSRRVGGMAGEENFTFHASGTNRELQRLVVFTGAFVLTNAAPRPGAGLLGVKAETAARAAASAALKGLIQGKVQIGGTNEFEIRARQTSP